MALGGTNIQDKVDSRRRMQKRTRDDKQRKRQAIATRTGRIGGGGEETTRDLLV